MAVPKYKRKESQFEVIKHFYRTRKEITDLLLRDFGYSQKKADESLDKMFGGKAIGEMSDEERAHYDARKKRQGMFENWFIGDQRNAVMDCLRKIGENIFMANSIYPTNIKELDDRRRFQGMAIGQCFRLLQEMQYAIDILPVDINKYERFAQAIDKEISLLKGWRKKDNKHFKRVLSDTPPISRM